MTTTVHHYKVLDQTTGEWKIQPLKCTEECIEKLGGKIVNGTTQTVAKSSLDATGHYQPPQRRQAE